MIKDVGGPTAAPNPDPDPSRGNGAARLAASGRNRRKGDPDLAPDADLPRERNRGPNHAERNHGPNHAKRNRGPNHAEKSRAPNRVADPLRKKRRKAARVLLLEDVDSIFSLFKHSNTILALNISNGFEKRRDE